MLVRIAFGVSRGEVHDFLPHEARAMVADGRATWPEGSPFYTAPDTPVVAAREDRNIPRHKRRAQR